MPLTTIPAIDQNVCGGWTEQQVDLYNKLPFYLAKMQVDYRSSWTTWARFLGSRKWQRNMGDTLKAVTKEPSPHLRQTANPALMSAAPMKDVVDVRERTATAQVRRHRFESVNLNFVPDFQDFMTDHVDAAGQDIMEKQTRFEDLFYRTQINNGSPKVWVTGKAAGPLVAAPMELPTETTAAGITTLNGANAKSTAWYQAQIAALGANGRLGFEEINRLLTVAEQDERIRPFTGSDIPKENAGLTGKFALVCSAELFNSFTFDPYLQANKNCQLDVVNGRFLGSLFGRITCIIEDKPFRLNVDGKFYAPEVRVLDPNAFNYGESIPNPYYTALTDVDGSPLELAYLVGAEGWEKIDVGPPPSQFSSNGMPKGFGKMFWNGEVMITKNILVPCPTADNANNMELNTYGEYLRFISQTTFGILGKQKRNIIPVLFKRSRGPV